MNNSKWIAAHFSPTGTTAKTARVIVKGSGCAFREIDLSVPIQDEQIGTKDVLVVATPVCGGRVPAAALKRFAQLRGSKKKAVAGGCLRQSYYEDTLLELKNTLQVNGFQVIMGAGSGTQGIGMLYLGPGV